MIFGTTEESFFRFAITGSVIVLCNFALLLIVEIAERVVLNKLGGSSDCDAEYETVKMKWEEADELNDGNGQESSMLRDVEQQVMDEERKRSKSKSLSTKLKNVRKTKLPGIRLSAMGRGMRKFGMRIRTADRLSGLGFNPDHFKIFQRHFMRLLRIANMMQGFYIAL